MDSANKLPQILGFLLVLLIALSAASLAQKLEAASPSKTTAALTKHDTIAGVVIDAKGPVAGATVRIQATERSAVTAADGAFTLTNLHGIQPLTVTASAPGYYIGWEIAKPGEQALHIEIEPHYTTDNHEYTWFSHEGLQGSAACGQCHQAYPEWQADAHSQSATNVRFATLYAGSDVTGKRSPLTRYDGKKGVALPPDLKQPYYGPGFKLDNPERSGNCATCHAPSAAKIPTNDGCSWSGCHTSSTAARSELIRDGATPLGLTGHAAEGISCEFCHKIADVQIRRKTGLPYEDSPGILSLRLLRPQSGQDLFFGPFDDIARSDVEKPRDVHLPLQRESKFCASCHYGVMGGVVADMKVSGGVLIYSSYKEWLESPYSEPTTGQTCQDCHMPPTGRAYFAYPEKGGRKRDPQQLSNHKMLGASDPAFMQNAVTLTATAQIQGGQLLVNVAVTNDQTGHAVPTDSTLRHVMLIVQAQDSTGKTLSLRNGTKLPVWTGDYAGQPGRTYAKLLRDTWTGEMPSAAIWRPVEIVEDTRLQPLATDQSRYTFALPANQQATVEVRLVYRRAFQQLAAWKGWDDPDIVMEQTTLQVGK